jgi:hypothetical protein
MQTGLADVSEELNRRIDPLVNTVKDHSMELARLKDARG